MEIKPISRRLKNKEETQVKHEEEEEAKQSAQD